MIVIKIQKICQYCGKEYEIEKCREERNKFCSDACMRASRRTKVPYKCDYCGKEFMVHSRKIREKENGERKGIFCSKKCAKDIQRPTFDTVKDTFEARGYKLLSTEYVSAKTKMDYICLKHEAEGVQSINWSNLHSGFGCKYCGQERVREAKKKGFDVAYEVFAKNGMILCEQEYQTCHTPMAYICQYHPEVGIQYKSLSNAARQHCPYCSISKGEEAIKDYLVANNITFEAQKAYNGLLGVGGGHLSYDFYLPDNNILIEYQGEFHDNTVSCQTDEEYKIRVEHDNRKRLYAKSSGIELLEIWYYDKDNINEILDMKLKTA